MSMTAVKSLVSVIIPSYNTEKYVREAVDSALRQTHKNIEVIVVDDGSTDGTKAILEPYIKSGQITYIYQANKGLAGARNTGLHASRGEYIALLDADDIFMPEKIARQVAHLETNPQCDVSYCDLYHFWDEETDKLFKLQYQYYSGKEVLPHLLAKNFIAPLSTVFRRGAFEKFGYFDENFRRSEDLEFWLRLAYAGANFCFLPEILGKLRMRRTANLQGIESQPQVKLTMLQVLNKLNDKMTSNDKEKYNMRHHLMVYQFRIGLAYLLNAKKSEAKKYILESFKDYPLGGLFGGLCWIPFAVLPAAASRWCVMKAYSLLRFSRLRRA